MGMGIFVLNLSGRTDLLGRRASQKKITRVLSTNKKRYIEIRSKE